MSYDSTDDTLLHISEVRDRLYLVCDDLEDRASNHDRSKLEPPEKEMYDEFTPKLKGSTYDSDPDSEYQGFLKAMGPALQHHYQANDHHPEHFPNGIEDMNLMQMVEMLCDWAAAVMRHDNGDLAKSIRMNAERFGYGQEIERLLLNTATSMGWIK